MKLISDFAYRFNVSLSIDENLVMEKRNRYFLLNAGLKRLVSRDFFYAGIYLGKVKNRIFFPSFTLLDMIAEKEKANKTIINRKAEWLFVCGRDLLKQGIVSVAGSRGKGTCTLVLNERGECLGFGKIISNPDQAKDEHAAIVKNISDIGDFLRRER
jgi:ribosome biogenesis protein Nip4